jgi:hypothetical protein
MSDVVIQCSRTCKIQQVEDFPEKAKRSRKGALHLRPGATLVVTRDELKHLEASTKRAFMVVGKAKGPPAEEAKKPTVATVVDDGGKGKGAGGGGEGNKPPAAKPAKGGKK